MDGFCLSITSSLRLLGSSPRTSVRQDVGRLRLSPSISSGGTREPRAEGPRWVSDERRRERTAYGTVFHPSFTSPFFPRSYVSLSLRSHPRRRPPRGVRSSLRSSLTPPAGMVRRKEESDRTTRGTKWTPKNPNFSLIFFILGFCR